jgi:PII-like signaling protein
LSISEKPKWMRLRIYIGEGDRYKGKPLYLYLLIELKKRGIRGATVYKGIAGYGSHSLIHTVDVLRLSEDLPIVIEVIDESDKIETVLPIVESLVKEGLITVDPVRLVYYGHKKS